MGGHASTSYGTLALPVVHRRCKTDGLKVAQDPPTGTNYAPEPGLLVKQRTACTLNRRDWYCRVQHVYWGV
mgnify:CR=1 FL=1